MYKPRGRWRRRVAFLVTVLGLTALVMLIGIWLVMVLTGAPSPGHGRDRGYDTAVAGVIRG